MKIIEWLRQPWPWYVSGPLIGLMVPVLLLMGNKSFGVGVGTLVLTLNVILLGGYTFGCHSFRHLIGGGIDQLSRRPLRKKSYDCVSCLNRRHSLWAWCSLVWVMFTDLYIRLCSMGVWTDGRII